MVACAIVCATACTKRPQECQAVIDTIDLDDQQIKDISARATEDAKDLAPLVRQAAQLEEQLVVKLGALQVATKELADDVGEYVSFAKELSAAATAMADVLEQIATMKDRADAVLASRDAALDKLKVRCTALPSLACRALDSATKPLDEIKDEDAYGEQAAKIDAVAARIAALRLADGDLAREAEEYVKVLRSDAELLRDLGALTPKIGASQGGLTSAMAKEQPVTDEINVLCIGHK